MDRIQSGFGESAVRRAARRYAFVCATALLGCSACAPTAIAPPATPETAVAAPNRVLSAVVERCAIFASNFDEFAACRRADGTLQTFGDFQIAWRVRYFVRYWEMPCNEAPTREESYVFQMTTADLYADLDLIDSQRSAIRNAMFSGRVRCR